MNIQTKYNVGDTVWYCPKKDQIKQTSISAIRFDADDDGEKLSYVIKRDGSLYTEDELFESQEAFYQSLIDQHNAKIEEYAGKIKGLHEVIEFQP